jgi:CheY-like chemotaxis protein
MQPHTPKILIVDDEKVIRDFLTRLLKLNGIDAVAVDSGLDAVARAQQEKFDVVFLDVRMPKIDGLETMRALKQHIPQARYVMMTGYAVDDILQQAQKEGASASIRKPFDISQIDMILKDHVARTGATRTLKILVIDDEEVVRDFFARLLKDSSYELVCAKSQEEALEYVRERDFDLVFMDMIIKDVSGVDLYAKLRQLKPNLDIVLITGYPAEAQKLSQDERIRGCLYKPFEIDGIMAEINKLKQG